VAESFGYFMPHCVALGTILSSECRKWTVCLRIVELCRPESAIQGCIDRVEIAHQLQHIETLEVDRTNKDTFDSYILTNVYRIGQLQSGLFRDPKPPDDLEAPHDMPYLAYQACVVAVQTEDMDEVLLNGWQLVIRGLGRWSVHNRVNAPSTRDARGSGCAALEHFRDRLGTWDTHTHLRPWQPQTHPQAVYDAPLMARGVFFSICPL
jgi:hypothetical protein